MADTYTVEGGKLKKDGVLYNSGDYVELEEVQAAPLLKSGRVKLVETKPAEEPPQPPQDLAPAAPPPAPVEEPPLTPPAPTQPEQVTGQPTPEEIARTAAGVQ